MHPAIEKRLKRLSADMRQAEDEEIKERLLLRARVEFGGVLRQMLQERGVDPATVVMLKVVDEAAAALARKPDTPSWRDAEASYQATRPNQDREVEAFYNEILRLALIHYADGHRPDPAKSSLAEWHAWCVATPASKHEPNLFADPFVQSYQRYYHKSVAADLANHRWPLR